MIDSPRMTLLLATLLLAACGGPGEQGAAETAAGQAPSGKVDACALLAAADPAAVLGGATDGGNLLWESHGAGVSISQCQYAASSGERRIGLLARRSGDSRAPGSRQELISRTRSEDLMGMGAETAEALEAGREVAGLGELAVAYELFSFNLMVWKGDWQLTVMLDGYAGDEAGRKAEQVARAVLGRI